MGYPMLTLRECAGEVSDQLNCQHQFNFCYDRTCSLLEASNYLQTKELNTRCIEFMIRNLDVSNCVAVLKLADQLSLERLLQDCINFIGDHFQLLFE